MPPTASLATCGSAQPRAPSELLPVTGKLRLQRRPPPRARPEVRRLGHRAFPPRVPWPWLSGGRSLPLSTPRLTTWALGTQGSVQQGVRNGRGWGRGFMLGSFPVAVNRRILLVSSALGLPCPAGILSSECCFPLWAVSKSLRDLARCAARPSRRLQNFQSLASKGFREKSLRM